MFDKLFGSQAVAQRHLSSPLLQERLEYLQHCANQGYTLTTLRGLAADLLLIQNLLGLATSSDSLGLAGVQAGVRRWVDRRSRHFKYKNGRRGRVQVLSRALRWLRFSGRLRLQGEAPPAYRSLLEAFADYLRVEKGLSEGTIQTRHWYVEDFLAWFFRDHNSLRQITITDVDEAMARKGARPRICTIVGPGLCLQPPLLPSICREQRLVHTRTRRISRIAAGVSARKPSRRSILERCAAPCRHHRGIPAQGYSGSRYFASPRRLCPALRRSAGPEVGRLGLGKGLAFRLAHQRAKARTLSPLSHRRPSHHPLSQRSAPSVFVSRSLSDR